MKLWRFLKRRGDVDIERHTRLSFNYLVWKADNIFHSEC